MNLAHPGIMARLGMALSVMRRGGIAQAVEHFRRVAASNGSAVSNDEAYAKIVAVHVCVQRIAGNIASMPFYVSTADDRIIESGPVADLIDRPSAHMSTEAFWQETVAWYLLTGRVHWVFDDGAYRSGRPRTILPVGAGQMRPITDGPPGTQRGNVLAWHYRRPGERWDQAERLDLAAVWTIRNPSFDPDRPYDGISPVEVVRRAIAQVYKSDVANESSLDNGVEPGGALIHKNGVPSDEQRRLLREEMTERHAGPRNRRRPVLLYGEWDWKQISSSFSDMEFTQLKLVSRGEICAAFGLPHAAMFEPSQASSSEYIDKAIEMIWTDATLPHAYRFAGEFDRGVLAKFESDVSMRMHAAMKDARPIAHHAMMVSRAGRSRRRQLYGWFDASSIDAMKKLMASRIETATKMVEGLYETPAHAGSLMDLGLSGNAAQQMVWQRTSMMPFDPALAMPGSDDEPGDETPPDATEDDAVADTEDEDRSTATREASEAQLGALWLGWRNSWRGIERGMVTGMTGHLRRLRAEMLANARRLLDNLKQVEGPLDAVPLRWVEDDGTPHARTYRLPAEQRDLIGEILFDLQEANGRLLAIARPLMRRAVQLGGQQAVDEVAAARGNDNPDPFNMQDPEALRAVRRRDTRIMGVNQRLAQRLRASIAEGMEAGENLGQIQDRIRARFNAANPRLVAFQETSSAVEESRLIGMKQSGATLRSWLHSRKETGRPSHIATEHDTMATPIGLDQDFLISGTGVTCPHPRATGRPEHDINCGCTTVVRFEGDTLREVIGGLLARGFTTEADLDARDAARTSGDKA